MFKQFAGDYSEKDIQLIKEQVVTSRSNVIHVSELAKTFLGRHESDLMIYIDELIRKYPEYNLDTKFIGTPHPNYKDTLIAEDMAIFKVLGS